MVTWLGSSSKLLRCVIPCTVRSQSSFTPLGSPIIFSSSCKLFTSRVNAITEIWSYISPLNDHRLDYQLLQDCDSPCRLIYVHRCALPHFTLSWAQNFDSECEKCSRILCEALPAMDDAGRAKGSVGRRGPLQILFLFQRFLSYLQYLSSMLTDPLAAGSFQNFVD